MREKVLRASVGVAICVVVMSSSCSGSDDGEAASSAGGTVISGLVTTYDGKPAPGMYVTADLVPDVIHVDPKTLSSARTGADGSFELPLTDMAPSDRWIITVLPERSATGAIAYAPTMGVVKPKPGVSRYQLPLRVAAAVTFDAAQGSVTVASGSRNVTLAAPPGARGTFYVAGLSVAGGIPLDVEGADEGTQLQSAGMLYIEPAPGSDLPADGFAVDVGTDPVPEPPGADAFAIYSLGPTAKWSIATPAPGPAIVPNGVPRLPKLARFGFWNCDRNYRTACVKGKVHGPGGRPCVGVRVSQRGPDGIQSNDSTGADGSFCVTGAQTFPAAISVGTPIVPATMPSSPGACNAQQTCAEIDVGVSDANCPGSSSPPSNPPPSGGSISCDTYLKGSGSAVGACSADLVTRACTKVGPNACPKTYDSSRAAFEKALGTFCTATGLAKCCSDAKAAAASRTWQHASVSILENVGKAAEDPKYCTFFGYCSSLIDSGTTDPAEQTACEKLGSDLDACNSAAWPEYGTWDSYAKACEDEGG